ncbi:MAG: FAD binding domain-containing protein [Candidatus Thorarchaeota archaeon]
MLTETATEIRFILNNETIITNKNPNMTLLDFIRYEKNLKGTKIGCREGDCGACTVLLGEITDHGLIYKNITSCLTPLANVSGRHVVSIEGINRSNGLTPVQESMCENGGTQCGFCTVGFIVSLTEYCINTKEFTFEEGIRSINGNICRCTGYKSIERSIYDLIKKLKNNHPSKQNNLEILIEHGYLPEYFIEIESRLKNLPEMKKKEKKNNIILGGGTDLYVQKLDELQEQSINFLKKGDSQFKYIKEVNNYCLIGSGTTFAELESSYLMNRYFSDFKNYIKLIASSPIRNLATIGGNIVNASPIGDFIIYFLALDAILILDYFGSKRELPLKDFYLSYKNLKKKPDELVDSVKFLIPDKNTLFNFEKVSKIMSTFLLGSIPPNTPMFKSL